MQRRQKIKIKGYAFTEAVFMCRDFFKCQFSEKCSENIWATMGQLNVDQPTHWEQINWLNTHRNDVCWKHCRATCSIQSWRTESLPGKGSKLRWVNLLTRKWERGACGAQWEVVLRGCALGCAHWAGLALNPWSGEDCAHGQGGRGGQKVRNQPTRENLSAEGCPGSIDPLILEMSTYSQ